MSSNTPNYPDYAAECGRVEAMLEGYFDAFDRRNFDMQRYHLKQLRTWLTARQAQSAQLLEEVQEFTASLEEEQASQLAKPGK